MCKVSSCPEKHSHHYCKVCKDTDSDHSSYFCPKGTIIFHGTSRQYANNIRQNGFKPSSIGRIGEGVYFTKSIKDAKRIAQYKFGNNHPVVIECFAQVDYREFKKEDSVEELMRKHKQWHSFCKETAKQAIHPPWANCQEFREVCVKDPKGIIVRKIYDV